MQGRLSSETGPGQRVGARRYPRAYKLGSYAKTPKIRAYGNSGKKSSRPSTPIPQTSSSSVPGSGNGRGNVATPTIAPSSLMPFATVDVAPGTLNVVK